MTGYNQIFINLEKITLNKQLQRVFEIRTMAVSGPVNTMIMHEVLRNVTLRRCPNRKTKLAQWFVFANVGSTLSHRPLPPINNLI